LPETIILPFEAKEVNEDANFIFSVCLLMPSIEPADFSSDMASFIRA